MLRTIKEVLESLPDEKKRLLMYAFENSVTQYVELENGDYIGVNTSNVKNLSVESCAGNWYVGKIRRDNVAY